MSKTSEIGYGKPPASTRFQKGRSGNLKGRPRGRHNRPPYDAVLGQMVTITENGLERRVTVAEAFLLYMTKRGLDGDGAAARAAMAAIEEARPARTSTGSAGPLRIVRKGVDPGSVNSALEPLRMATKLDRFRPSARILLEPWLVEAALARLGEWRLSREEQAKVVHAVRTPHKVRWPHWWEINPKSRAGCHAGTRQARDGRDAHEGAIRPVSDVARSVGDGVESGQHPATGRDVHER